MHFDQVCMWANLESLSAPFDQVPASCLSLHKVVCSWKGWTTQILRCSTMNAMQCNRVQSITEPWTSWNATLRWTQCNRSTEINDVGKSYSWREKEKALNSSDDCYLNPSAQYVVELQTDLRIKSICLNCARNWLLSRWQRFIRFWNVSMDYRQILTNSQA